MNSPPPKNGPPLVATVLLVWLGLMPALYANEASRGPVIRGGAELTRNRFAEALQFFQQAVAADPQDGDAHFLTGLALNRLGRHSEALASLEQAEKLKTQYRDLYFELGWAYLFTRQFKQAVSALTRYETIKPGRGIAQELLGRAHLALGEDDKAEAALREALRRDPRLAATCNYYLGALALRRGEKEKAVSLLEDLSKKEPSTAVGRSARTMLETERARERRWSLSAAVGGGYDSNVIQGNASGPLPSGISHRDAGFAQTFAGAGYDLIRAPADLLRADYEFNANVYGDVSDFDTTDHRVALSYRHQFKDRVAVNLGLDNPFGEVGGDPSSYDLAFSPALDIRLADWAVLRVPYMLTASENFISVAAPLNRDGTSQTLGVVQFLQCPPLGMTGRVGYSHIWNETEGSDYDSNSDAILAGVNWSLPWKMTLDVSYARIFERYSNPNSFTDFTLRRRDDVNLLRVELSKSLDQHWSVRAAYDFARPDSNLPTYDYQRHAFTMGVNFRY